MENDELTGVSRLQTTIHQALFGYSNGHHLLSASRPFTSGELKILEPLSDLSGSGMPSGFDGYLTGYYLRQAEYFVLCKTWFAREMPRPGCVWTHAFLIPSSLSNSEIKLLLAEKNFVRPDIARGDWKQAYTEEVRLDAGPNNSMSCIAPEEGTPAHRLLSLLVLKDSPVVISADSCTVYNEVLSILLQELPLSFFKEVPFCAGAFSNRMIDRTLFQLQVVPNEVSKSAWKMRETEVIFCTDDEVMRNKVAFHAAEISEAIGLLEVSGIGTFSRHELSQLLSLMVVIDTMPISALQEKIAGILNLCDGRYERLIQLVMRRCFANILETYSLKSGDALADLCTVELELPCWDTAISSEDIGNAVRKLLMLGDKAVFEMINRLFTGALNELGRRVLRSLANALDEKLFLDYITDNSDKTGVLVSLNPNLALYTRLWMCSYGIQSDALNALSRLYRESKNTEDAFYKNLLLTIYKNSRESLIDRIYQSFSSLAIDAFFSWAEQTDNVSDYGWCRICRKEPVQSVTSLMGVTKQSVFLEVIGTLYSRDPALQTIKPEVWDTLYRRFCKGAAQIVQETYAKFLTPVILLSDNRFPEALADFAFKRVHRILAESRMDDMSWGDLSDILPELMVFNMWDRCKRLRKAVKNKGYSVDL